MWWGGPRKERAWERSLGCVGRKGSGHPDRTCLTPGHLCFCSRQAGPCGPSPDSALSRRLSTGLTSCSLRPCLSGLLGCICRNPGSLLSLGGRGGSASPCQHDKGSLRAQGPFPETWTETAGEGGMGPLASLRNAWGRLLASVTRKHWYLPS